MGTKRREGFVRSIVSLETLKIDPWINYDCPVCGEENVVLYEEAESASSMIEDCTICCRPNLLQLAIDYPLGAVVLTISADAG